MPTPHDDDVTDQRGVGPAGLRVPPGPLADALQDLEDAREVAEDGRRLVQERRRAIGPALASTLARVPADERTELVRELYWHAEDVRVVDLATGLGVPTGSVRRVAGPLPVEVDCWSCGAPVVVERTSRSQRPTARCRRCAEVAERLDAEQRFEADRSFEADQHLDVVDGAEIGARVGLRLDAADGCDGTLRQTQDVAFELGLVPEEVLEWSRRSGGFCDCELLVNVLGRW